MALIKDYVINITMECIYCDKKVTFELESFAFKNK